MTTIEAFDFKANLLNWTIKNCLQNINTIDFGCEFSYNIAFKKVSLSFELNPIVKEFNKVLDELDFPFEDVPAPILAFLHEVGHAQTLFNFTREEMGYFNFQKIYKGVDINAPYNQQIEQVRAYWNIADEYAANKWIVDFAKSNPNAIMNLFDIFCDSNYKCYFIDDYDK